MSRKYAREILMRYVYQMEMNQNYFKDDLDYDCLDEDIGGPDKEFIESSLTLLIENLDSIDASINSYLEGWTMDRIPRVDLAILRVAFNEINNREDIPDSVAINEAVNMAKKYSTEDSYKFINGVLGSYHRAIGEKDG